MPSQGHVARRFARGEDPATIPSASNFHAAEAPEESDFEAVLLSYGWAVVFARRPDGTVVEFEGWHGYSPSTSTQMGKARREIEKVGVLETDSRQPKMGGSMSWRARQSGAEPL